MSSAARSPVLIAGAWRDSTGRESFQAINPATRTPLPATYPVSPWSEVEAALEAAQQAFATVQSWPGARFAAFLEACADRIAARADALVATAHAETALPVEPRLKTAELPRTINQLRQAAAAAREGSWALPTIDTAQNIRSMYGAIGPVVVFGPNNFPFAFNGLAGGDFAAAVAAGNPVLGKAHTSHPGTSRLLAEAAHEAAQACEFPPGFIQMIYRTAHADGLRLAAHPAVGALGYTGARTPGLAIKQAADAVGKPVYLELSSINPIVVLPGALEERLEKIVEEFCSSCLMGAGQFCTNPGLVLLREGAHAEQFLALVAAKFAAAPAGTLLSEAVERHLAAGVAALVSAGASVVAGGRPADPARCCFANTLLRVSGDQFLERSQALQTEAFGNASLVVVCRDDAQLAAAAERLEGNLTGCIYSATTGADDDSAARLAPTLRRKVGRLLNDKMPTGVAVSSAMNHGGPFPATGHPGFTAVGVPASLRRFAMLQCYDNVRPHRLPPSLQDASPGQGLQRLVDGRWTTEDIRR